MSTAPPQAYTARPRYPCSQRDRSGSITRLFGGRRREVGLKYGSRSTQFVLGDFVAIAGTLPDADVVTLDRVVCCYPDAEVLLVAAAARTRQVLAFTYPHDRWYVRTMFAFGNFWLWVTGKKFRAFVHAPERMAAVLETAGLVRTTQRETLAWTLDLYRRERDI